MIAMRYKSTIFTPMLSRGEPFARSMSALRAILRRAGRIHLDYLTASIFRFTRQDRDELTPPRVTDAPGEMMILNHSPHVQIFNGDRVKLLDEVERRHSLNYTLVVMATQQLQALYHCVFSLQFHLVLVTKHRRKVISEEMKKRLGVIFLDTLRKWERKLIEFKGEADHVHLLFSATPKVALRALVNNLKTVSSRLIRKEFKQEVSKVYRKPVFWQRSYCLLTCGGAPLSVIKQYIRQQGES